MRKGFLLALISFNAFAIDCGGLSEGQVVRIDQGNGSLSKAAVQDQDGLGSCFANQTALLLQAAIPGNPNLSYLNLGLYYSADNTLKDKRTKGDKNYTLDASESGSSLSGGFACKTIDAALERQRTSGTGILCKSEDVNLEHGFFKEGGGVNNMLQENSLTKASRYMNTYQKTFGYSFEKNVTDAKKLQEQRIKADQFKNALKNFINKSGDTFYEKKCSQPDSKLILSAVENAFTRALNENTQCLGSNVIKPAGSACQSFSNFGILTAIGGTGKSGKVAFIQNGTSRQEIQNASTALLKNKGGIDSYLSGLAAIIKKADKSKSTDAQKDAFAKMIISKISPVDKRDLQSDYERVVLKDMTSCKSDNFLAYFQDKNNFLDKAKKDVVLCNYSELLGRAADLASALPAKTFKNMSGFIDFITAKAGLEYDEALLSLIANDCTPEKRVKIPDNLKCEYVRTDFTPADFPGNGMSERATASLLENRKKTIQSIQNNRGVGITICSKYWKDPNFDFNKEPVDSKYKTCSTAGKHGIHAITTIGYRCKNNKIQYLAQNSWGPNWQEQGLEIENGKVWLDEEKLFKNIATLNYISP